MESPKEPSETAATYKPILEKDMEEQAVSRPKSLTKLLSGSEPDGADEKMLPDDDKKVQVVNMSEVKLSPNEKQNGDAKLDIGETKNTFGGMDKEELMKYANDPFWVRLRWFLFITFWLLWAAMLVGAIMIIYAAPKCDPPPPRTWWQEGPLAELKSDLQPEDLKSLDKNIKGVIVGRPGDSYDNINDSDDVVKLIKSAKETGTRIIVDLNPATSNFWFAASESEPSGNFSDYYIWKASKGTGNGGSGEAPNNWLNATNDPSWTYSPIRKEYFYSPFGQPHLNFREASVVGEFTNVIKKFLEYGASGIRIRNAPYLLVDPKFENETDIVNAEQYEHKQYRFYAHSKTQNQPDLGKLLYEWKTVVRNISGDGPFMVAEELSKVESYKVNKTLMVDLPLKKHVFARTDVDSIINSLNHTFNIDNVDWPLWKVNTSTLPADVLDIVTQLLPGTTLVDSNSTVNTHLLKIRESPSIMRGICSMHSINNKTVFAFIRVTSGNPGILVALNTKNETVTADFRSQIPALSQLEEVTIQHYSSNFNETDFTSLNAKKDASKIPISPKSVIVLSYVPKKKD